MKTTRLLVILISGMLFVSCSMYTIPVESFKTQFDDVAPSLLEMKEVQGANGLKYSYLGNDVKEIYCKDAKGNPVVVKNNPLRLVRFTFGEDNQTAVCYFDQIYVEDSKVIGTAYKFNDKYKKEIPLDAITKIEMQEVGKNFKYMEEVLVKQ